MKTTTKLIGIVSALIVITLAIFLVTKFNSHESARVGTSSSSVQTVKKSSSSSSKVVKNQLDHHLRQSQMKKMTIRPQQ